MPCHHAIFALYRSKQYPEDFVHNFFKNPLYLDAYNRPIYPVPGEDLWTKTNTPDIDPPVFKFEKGSVQTKGGKGSMKFTGPR